VTLICTSCRTERAACDTPVENGTEEGGSASLCWTCAHAVVEHGSPIAEAADLACTCPPSEIYPGVEPDPLPARLPPTDRDGNPRGTQRVRPLPRASDEVWKIGPEAVGVLLGYLDDDGEPS